MVVVSTSATVDQARQVPRQEARQHPPNRPALVASAAEDEHRNSSGLAVAPEPSLATVVDVQATGTAGGAAPRTRAIGARRRHVAALRDRRRSRRTACRPWCWTTTGDRGMVRVEVRRFVAWVVVENSQCLSASAWFKFATYGGEAATTDGGRSRVVADGDDHGERFPFLPGERAHARAENTGTAWDKRPSVPALSLARNSRDARGVFPAPANRQSATAMVSKVRFTTVLPWRSSTSNTSS